jgi:acyl-CoA thioesterase FadM
MLDALFTGLKDALSDDYPSLNNIHFVDFAISGDFESYRNAAHSDAALVVRLAVANSSGRRFEFSHKSRSISASSAGVVVRCVEHFVNAELAVLQVHNWIADAKKRHRQDLVDKYTQRLADLVQNASYSESIERSRAAKV